MKTIFKFLSLAAILAVAASPAAHATEVFNAQLTQGPGTTSAAKVYYGSGNINAGFDVAQFGTLQLGLEAVTRGVGPITPSHNDYLYTPNAGTLANWDFAFSVNTGTSQLSAYTYQISIKNLTNGQQISGDPTLGFNAQSNGSTVACNNCAYSGSNNGFQNAENLGFSFLQSPGVPPLGFQFDPNAADTYQITLTAYSQGVEVAADSINVLPTPEPSSLVFLGTGLLGGLGTMIRRRRIV
jgi:PEP-CTERM motif